MQLINELLEYVTLSVLFNLFAILVMFDVMTGVTKAWKNGRMKSRTLRNGLFASIGEFMILGLGIILQYMVPFPPLHIIIYALFVIMIYKELYSILENLIVLGVKVPKWLVNGLEVYIKENEETIKK